MKHVRRSFIHAAALACLTATWVSPMLAQQKVGSATISVVPSTSAVVLFVARDGGYFEREGLDVKITEFASGAEAERAMVAGAVDMGGGGVGTTLLMANQQISRMEMFTNAFLSNQDTMLHFNQIKGRDKTA